MIGTSCSSAERCGKTLPTGDGISVIVYACNRIRSLDTMLQSLSKNSSRSNEVVVVEDHDPRMPVCPSEQLGDFRSCTELLNTGVYRYTKLGNLTICRMSYSGMFKPTDPNAYTQSWHHIMAQAVNEGATKATRPWLAIFGNVDIYYGPCWDEHLLAHVKLEDNILVPVVVFGYAQSNPYVKATPGYCYDRADAYWCYTHGINNTTGNEASIDNREDRMVARHHISEKHFLNWVKNTGTWKPSLQITEDGPTRRRSSQYAHVVRQEAFWKMGGIPVDSWAFPGNTDVWNTWDEKCNGPNQKVACQGSVVMTTEFPIVLDATTKERNSFRLFPKPRRLDDKCIRASHDTVPDKQDRATDNPIRVAFFGGGIFGEKIAKCLYANPKISVVCAVVNPHKPDRITDRSKEMINIFENSTTVCLESAMTKDVADKLTEIAPDLVVIAYYDYLLPPKVFQLPWMGSLNIHLGDPKRHRGCFPTTYALLDGDKDYRVVIHYIDQGIDSGPVLFSREFPIQPTWTGRDLYLEAIKQGVSMFEDSIDKIVDGVATPAQEPKSDKAMPREFPTRQISLTAEQKQAIKAFTFPGFPPPFVDVDGQIYEILLSCKNPQ